VISATCSGTALWFLPSPGWCWPKAVSDYMVVWLGDLPDGEFGLGCFWPSGSHGLFRRWVFALVGYLTVIGFLERRPLVLALSVLVQLDKHMAAFCRVLLSPCLLTAGCELIGHGLRVCWLEFSPPLPVFRENRRRLTGPDLKPSTLRSPGSLRPPISTLSLGPPLPEVGIVAP